jgi:hypothetical protein
MVSKKSRINDLQQARPHPKIWSGTDIHTGEKDECVEDSSAGIIVHDMSKRSRYSCREGYENPFTKKQLLHENM